MQLHATSADPAARRHRPRTFMVLAAAFAAGAVLAYGIDRVVDVHVVQVEPQVESEPIFVALRSLPQGAPVTVWDVALKDWPKAMLPTTALKADASFEGLVLRHPVREGQPLLSVQLVRDTATPAAAAMAALVPVASPAAAGAWVPAQPAGTAAPPAAPAAEHFVPATPAQPPVAAAAAERVPVGAVAEPVGAEAAASTATTGTPDAGVAVVEPLPAPSAVADTDIDAATAPRPTVPDAESTATSPPSLVTTVQPLPAGDDVSSELPAAEPVAAEVEASPSAPTPAMPQLADATPRVMEVVPTVAAAVPQTAAGIHEAAASSTPLVAPVPSLPSTDIERSLARFGRQPEQPGDRTSSVLDRSSELPAPSPVQSAPRYHLVVPERIALAADASFTQQPQRVAPPAQVAPATPGNARGPAATPTKPTATRPDSRSRAATTPSPGTRPSAVKPAMKPGMKPGTKAATKADAKPAHQQAGRPQSAPARGLGAWFPQFSGGTLQR